MKNILISISIILLVIFNLTSCNDFLDHRASGAVDQETLTNHEGVQMLITGMYAGLLNGEYFSASLSNFAYGDVMGGSANKGSDFSDQPDFTNLETYKLTTGNGYINTKWAYTYDGVFKANEVLSNAESCKESISKINGVEKDFYTEAVAQARFIRGFFHFEAVKNFGAAVPYVSLEDYEANVNPQVPNVDESNQYIYIWDKIYEDLQFAYDNLPDAWPNEPGRVNKWAAAAFLAKAKIYQSSPYNGTNGTVNRWEEAKELIETILAQGKDSKGTKYKLAQTYEELWIAGESDWTGESIFDIQMTIVGTNEMLSCINGGPHIAPPSALGGGGWGFYQPSSELVNSHMVNDNGLPYLDNSYRAHAALTLPKVDADGKVHPNQPVTDLNTFTDPRLDISVGRFLIPYWDWAVPSTTDGWVRDVSNGGYFMNKKNMPKKADKGSLSISSIAGSSAKNFHLMRYADLLLLYAETLIETGHHAEARQYVNQVRSRAANSYVTAKEEVKGESGITLKDKTTDFILEDLVNNLQGENAASNYRIGLYPEDQFNSKEKALEALRFERKIELAMEGQRWYDLVRWGIAETELNDYVKFEKQYLPKFTLSTYNAKWVTLPIPEKQIVTMDGLLIQNPNWK